ncbi:unnamed protein product [Ilex paraguariensis]|uniref:non-specific serine/threonine protein kinase n=1 Tax=Ilex paraguariensis TaxID=185542 RepID=A0ABC8S4R6_9AQUA
MVFMCKPFSCRSIFQVNPPDVVPSDQVEVDFSDVFGPLPVQPPNEVSNGVSEDLINGHPVITHNQSNSTVGLSALKLHNLTIDDTEYSKKLAEWVINESIKEYQVLSSIGVGEPSVQLDGISMKVRTVGLEDFEVMKLVGKGGFGKVFQVRKKDTSEIYAMKVIRKDKIIEKNHVEYIKAERDILAKIDHPFIVKLRYSFQSLEKLYLVMDFINGGHLVFHLHRHGLFREDLARIYAAEIVSAVCHLHENGIIHRDLKPENILLDSEGHTILTDFGLAKKFENSTRSNTICGTVEYMSPEIILGKGHDQATDWWSVGVLLFEMLTGKPPFTYRNREKVQRKIVKDKLKLPSFLSSEAHSLLKGLLQKDPSRRLGRDAIMKHKWFKAINWKKVEARALRPSFRPEVAGKHCVDNFDKRWTEKPLSDSPVSSPRKSGNFNFFQGFNFVRAEGWVLSP